MSGESWLKEFYPIPADETTKEEALAHSLLKWEGLRAKNLRKHGVVLDNEFVLFCDLATLVVGSSTCALCYHYYDHKGVNGKGVEGCAACPLFNIKEREDGGLEYSVSLRCGDPEPMIELIEEAIKKQAKGLRIGEKEKKG